jgi:hypothetical protein
MPDASFANLQAMLSVEKNKKHNANASDALIDNQFKQVEESLVNLSKILSSIYLSSLSSSSSNHTSSSNSNSQPQQQQQQQQPQQQQRQQHCQEWDQQDTCIQKKSTVVIEEYVEPDPEPPKIKARPKDKPPNVAPKPAIAMDNKLKNNYVAALQRAMQAAAQHSSSSSSGSSSSSSSSSSNVPKSSAAIPKSNWVQADGQVIWKAPPPTLRPKQPPGPPPA